MRRFPLFLAMTALATLSACPNVFDPIDSPSGDAQILSAARACFDKGDLQCALDNYNKLSTNETAMAESALVALDQVGLGIDEYARAISEGRTNTGLVLTRLVEESTPYAGSANRQALALAYRKIAGIQTAELRGFTRFMLSMGIAALTFAEHSAISADGVFNRNDVVNNATTCESQNMGTCNVAASCGGSTGGSNLAATDASDDTNFSSDPANATMSGTASWNKIFIAINSANLGLTEMGVSTGSSFELISQLLAIGADPSASLPCFRYALMTIPGVGR